MARKTKTQRNRKVGKKVLRRTGKKVTKGSKKTKKNSFFTLMLAAKKRVSLHLYTKPKHIKEKPAKVKEATLFTTDFKVKNKQNNIKIN